MLMIEILHHLMNNVLYYQSSYVFGIYEVYIGLCKSSAINSRKWTNYVELFLASSGSFYKLGVQSLAPFARDPIILCPCQVPLLFGSFPIKATWE